jgi:hypothetical protein
VPQAQTGAVALSQSRRVADFCAVVAAGFSTTPAPLLAAVASITLRLSIPPLKKAL